MQYYILDIKRNLGDNYAREVKINELKETSDIISLHTNLNQSSRHIIDKQFIDDCKKSFVLLIQQEENVLVMTI